MATTPKVFYRAAGGTSNVTLATVPAGKTWIITNIVVSNIGSTATTYTLFLDGVLILPQTSIAAYSFEVIDLKQVMDAGTIISGSTEAGTNVKWHISGVEIA